MIDTSKTTLKFLSDLSNGQRYYFRVSAVSARGVESPYSNENRPLSISSRPATTWCAMAIFVQGNANWSWTLQGSGAGSWQVTNGALKIDVTNPGSNYYDVQFRQNGIPLTRGQRYLFEFDAWADQPRIIEAKVGQDNDPFANYSKIGLSVIPAQKKHFSYGFLMEDASDGNARVVFNCGKSTIPGEIFVSNISVKQEVNSSVEQEKTTTPAAFALTNHPNPFRDRTVIEFELVQDAKVETHNRPSRPACTHAKTGLPGRRPAQRTVRGQGSEFRGIFLQIQIQWRGDRDRENDHTQIKPNESGSGGIFLKSGRSSPTFKLIGLLLSRGSWVRFPPPSQKTSPHNHQIMGACRFNMEHYVFIFLRLLLIGKFLIRLPVNRKTAFAAAGITPGTPYSPTPLGTVPELMISTSTWGDSFIPRIG